MTPPVYRLEQALARMLHTDREAIVLGLLFIVGAAALPLALVYAAAWSNQRSNTGGSRTPLRLFIARYAYSFVPLGFGIWSAHYLFHLLIGPLTIVPAAQRFASDMAGVALLGQADWQLAALWMPSLSAVQAVQMTAMAVGTTMALLVAWRAAQLAGQDTRSRLIEVAPWLAILVVLAIAAVIIFLLPMEMRGNVLG